MIGSKNFLDEYTSYASKLTDAPLDFHRFVGYSVMSTVINKGIYFPFGDTRIYPNLWIILLAPSSLYRKSTAIAIGRRILTEFNKNLIFPNEFSQEKILEVLSQQPQGVFYFYEFLTFMGLLQRDYMTGTKAFFTEMYDCPPDYSRVTKGQSFYIKDPFINILSATTLDWFLEQVKEGDMAGGFLPRFVIIPALIKPKSMPLPPIVDSKETTRIRALLYTFSDRTGPMHFNAEAEKEYLLWHHQFEAGFHQADKRIQAFLVRLVPYLLKFSMLEALCNGEKEISLSSFIKARTAVQWIAAQLKDISQDMEFTKTGRDRMKVLRFIRDAGQAGIQHSQLLRLSRLDSDKELRPAIKTLTEQFQVITRHIKAPDTQRSADFYFFLDHSNSNPLSLPEPSKI